MPAPIGWFSRGDLVDSDDTRPDDLWDPSKLVLVSEHDSYSLMRMGELLVVRKPFRPDKHLWNLYCKELLPDGIALLARLDKLQRKMAKLGFGPKVYESVIHDDIAYFYLEYLPGEYTEEMYYKNPDEVRDLVRKFHEAGFIHGDLHRCNIRKDAKGALRFIDFETTYEVGEPLHDMLNKYYMSTFGLSQKTYQELEPFWLMKNFHDMLILLGDGPHYAVRYPLLPWTPPKDDWARPADETIEYLVDKSGLLLVRKRLWFAAASYDKTVFDSAKDYCVRVANITQQLGKIGLGARVYEVNIYSDSVIILMEYLPTPLSKNTYFNRARSVGGLIRRLHRLGYSHGDIHPSNIRYDATGTPKLLGFSKTRSAIESLSLRMALHPYPEMMTMNAYDRLEALFLAWRLSNSTE